MAEVWGRGLMEQVCCSLKKGHQRIVGSHRGMRFVESLLLYRVVQALVGTVYDVPSRSGLHHLESLVVVRRHLVHEIDFPGEVGSHGTLAVAASLAGASWPLVAVVGPAAGIAVVPLAAAAVIAGLAGIVVGIPQKSVGSIVMGVLGITLIAGGAWLVIESILHF